MPRRVLPTRRCGHECNDRGEPDRLRKEIGRHDVGRPPGCLMAPGVPRPAVPPFPESPSGVSSAVPLEDPDWDNAHANAARQEEWMQTRVELEERDHS